jgi:CRISPR system Cascade subunit CasE
MIDVGDNPDRPRPGRFWLRNMYHVHQRLCMAFPSKEREEGDREFLKPYSPEDFAQGHVHVERGSNAGFLFRIDPQPGNSVSILVLSSLKPDWSYAFHNASHLLAAPPPEPRPLEISIEPGNTFRFRLTANPTKRLRKDSLHAKGDKIEEKWVGKRVPVPPDKWKEWLTRRAEHSGFRVREIANLQAGFAYFNRSTQRGTGQKLRSVRYEGVLEVTDAKAFRKTLFSGIGPAKAFGFGLLSLAPAR